MTIDLSEIQAQVRDVGHVVVADEAGMKQRRVARFLTNQGSITFVELQKIKDALARIAAAK